MGLAARVDALRGQVPFNRFVVEALEAALPSLPAQAESHPSKCVRCGRETFDWDTMDYTGPQPVCAVDCRPKPSRASVSPRAPYRKPFVPRPKGS